MSQKLLWFRVWVIVGLAVLIFAAFFHSNPIQSQDAAVTENLLVARGPTRDKLNAIKNRIKDRIRTPAPGQCDNECQVPEPQGPNPSLAGKRMPVDTPSMPTSRLKKLWDEIPERDLVKTQAARSFPFTPGVPTRCGPSIFYGCTIIILADSSGAIVGHLRQEHVGEITPEDQDYNANGRPINGENRFLINRPRLIERTFWETFEDAFAGVDLSPQAVAYILWTADKQNLFLSSKPAGYDWLKEQLIWLGIEEANIHSKPYESTAGEGVGVTGKAVVDWSVRPEGGNRLTIYLNSDTPEYIRDYDAQGNPCESYPQDMAP